MWNHARTLQLFSQDFEFKYIFSTIEKMCSSYSTSNYFLFNFKLLNKRQNYFKFLSINFSTRIFIYTNPIFIESTQIILKCSKGHFLTWLESWSCFMLDLFFEWLFGMIFTLCYQYSYSFIFYSATAGLKPGIKR